MGCSDVPNQQKNTYQVVILLYIQKDVSHNKTNYCWVNSTCDFRTNRKQMLVYVHKYVPHKKINYLCVELTCDFLSKCKQIPLYLQK